MTEETTLEEKGTIIDFQLVEDLQEFLAVSPDVKVENLLKDKINNFSEGTLVKVIKEIGSQTTIILVEEVTDELIEKEVW